LALEENKAMSSLNSVQKLKKVGTIHGVSMPRKGKNDFFFCSAAMILGRYQAGRSWVLFPMLSLRFFVD
jgi:hypothetical protein